MIKKCINIWIILIFLINIISINFVTGNEIFLDEIKSLDNNNLYIYINGNDDFTLENGVIGGDGSKYNPYIISGLYFDGTYQYRLDEIRWRNKIFEFIINYFFGEIETALTIVNTDKHVIIKDNIFINWNEPFPPQDPFSEVPKLSNHRGIKLSKTKNVTIAYNTFNKCNEGIDCYDSDVVIRDNEFVNIDGGYQIIYLDRQINSIIERNVFKNCECNRGIHIIRVKENTIINDNKFQNLDLRYGNIVFEDSENFVNITNNEFNQITSYVITGNKGCIENNEFFDCSICIKVTNSFVYNNLIQSTAIGISADGYYKIHNNDIINTDVGIGLYDDANQNSAIFLNNITGNGKGFYCITENPPKINFNNIYGNDIGIKNNDEIYIDALNNWWGASNGPSGEGTGDGDIIKGNVSFNPWSSEFVYTAGRQ